MLNEVVRPSCSNKGVRFLAGEEVLLIDNKGLEVNSATFRRLLQDNKEV